MITRTESQPMAIVKVYYALLSEVTGITYNTNQEATITFATGKDWKEFYGVFESIELTEPEDDTPAGALYNQQLKLLHPADDATIRKNIFDLKERELIIKLEYNNQNCKLLGEIQKPVYISSNMQSKSFETYREINFNTQSDQPARFLI